MHFILNPHCIFYYCEAHLRQLCGFPPESTTAGFRISLADRIPAKAVWCEDWQAINRKTDIGKCRCPFQVVEKVWFFKKSACSQSLSPNPFPRERGYITGATAPRPCRGLRPKARMLWLLAKSFARCKTNRASNKRHPFLYNQEVYRQSDAAHQGGISACR